MVEQNKSVEKAKKPRSEAQKLAFENARKKRAENLANKKTIKEPPKKVKPIKELNQETEPEPEQVAPTNKVDYDPFKEANKKNGVGQPVKKKELEVEYIEPEKKPKRKYTKKALPVDEEEEEDSDDDLWVDESSEEEIKPTKPTKPKPKAKKPKKPPKIIYESASEESEEEIIVKKKKPVKKHIDYSSSLSLKDKLRLNGF